MYLYYDDLGILREIINDEALRQYNDNVNTIYMYFEGDRTIDTLYIHIEKNNGDIVDGDPIDTSNENNYVIKQIVYDQDRLLNYFQYGKTYKFYKYTLSNSELDQAGAITITPMCEFVGGNFVVGAFTGVVEEVKIKPTEPMNMGQYLRLLNYITEITAKTSVLEIDSTNYDFGALDDYAVNTPPYIANLPDIDFDSVVHHKSLRIKFTLTNNGATATFNPTIHFSDVKDGSTNRRYTYTGNASYSVLNVVCPLVVHIEYVFDSETYRIRIQGLKELRNKLV